MSGMRGITNEIFLGYHLYYADVDELMFGCYN